MLLLLFVSPLMLLMLHNHTQHANTHTHTDKAIDTVPLPSYALNPPGHGDHDGGQTD